MAAEDKSYSRAKTTPTPHVRRSGSRTRTFRKARQIAANGPTSNGALISDLLTHGRWKNPKVGISSAETG
jgi:hypothetical protein